ncbi:type II secretion system GspH family protein [Patescibacteria group bacterium]|nr:type II secretion system GspH family protein [Patescibacteria group bacterium]
MKKNKNKRAGFTLIELLVVVAILGLLSTIVLFSVEGIRAKSRDVRRVGDVKSIMDGLAMYNNNRSVYPIYDGYIIGDDAMSVALSGDVVMSKAPVDPINDVMGGVTYKYYYQSLTGATYFIQYYLETNSIHDKAAGLNEVSP